MAMTPLERKRRSLERKAERLKLAGDPTDTIAKIKFHEAVTDSDWSEITTYLDWAGINPDAFPKYENDDDPQHDPETDGPYRGSIGRAERAVSSLLDAASQLAVEINHYKRKEILDRIHEIEISDLSDAEARKQALADIVRLKKMLDQLDKQVRWTFPQWKVTGE